LAAAIPAAAVQQVFLRKSRRDILRIAVLLLVGRGRSTAAPFNAAP
jgi:hypothetical protein